jgi:hypothetical protein
MLDLHKHFMPRIIGGKIQNHVPFIRGCSVSGHWEIEEPLDGGRKIESRKTRPDYVLLLLRFLEIPAHLGKIRWTRQIGVDEHTYIEHQPPVSLEFLSFG